MFKHPFNEELIELIKDFTNILKPIVDKIEKFGLKKYYLKRYKGDVRRFFNELLSKNYENEVAASYKKRLVKNRNKLFTFLDFDCVPWNNNNAEHAIKRFALLRSMLGGSSTEEGIKDYLILLSVIETCKIRGISFLEFLKSGKKNL